MKRCWRISAAMALLGLMASNSAWAQSVAAPAKLPPQMAWTAFDTGSAGFNVLVAIGAAFNKAYNIDLRVLPAGNDTARLAPLRTGKAMLTSTGMGLYYAQEGALEFGVKEWGPQPVSIVLTSLDCNAATIGVAGDIGVKEVKDLKGKRIASVVGAPGLNINPIAILAFAGLTRDDVKIVEFSSYGAMWKGVLNNEVDVGFAVTVSPQVREVAASPRGIVWPQTPAADKEGWARLLKVAPYFQPHKTTCGVGISADKPLELPVFPYPILGVYNSQPDELIYSIARALIDQYPAYKDAAPGAAGLDVKNQTVNWVMPYHPGAVRALKEAGLWTDAAQKHNDALFRRQEVLAAAWKAYGASNPPDDKFNDGWRKARAEALTKAGFDPVFN